MEVARAQRLGHPLSLVKLHLDHVVELEQALGRVGLQAVIQQVVKLIQSSGRVNDLYFRTEDVELSLVLPHCSHKGAAMRAERIRLMIEKHSFLNLGQRITVSQGIASYPHRADSAVDLDVLASKALDIARSRGGNRICLSSKNKEGKPVVEKNIAHN
jgi:diguanylate cyclase (GGDEF)-like protein